MTKFFHIAGRQMILPAIIVVLLFLSHTLMAQSFILDLQSNAMSFTNAQRTVIFDAGNSGTDAGSTHKYSNVITKDGITVYAILTILERNNATITDFDDDVLTGDPQRFQPRIGAGPGGGHVLYQLEFFNSSDDVPVFIYNYYLTGIDIDGDGTFKIESVEVGGYSSYTVDATTGLTITTNPVTGRTKFFGIMPSLAGVVFDNSASFISNYTNPNNKITFLLGQATENLERFYSIQLGQVGGAFTTPNTFNNPLPVAVDDYGTPVNSSTGGSSVPNVLTNDLYNGIPIVPGDVTITLVNPASNPGVVLNTTTGEVTVAPGTPAGLYTLTYQICMIASPSDCDMAIVYVEVTNADLAITKTVNPGVTIPGMGIAYTITVTNNGPTKAYDVEVEDILSANLTFVSATPSVGTWTAPTWEIGTMLNGDVATLTIVATTNIGFTGVIPNTAAVTSTTEDPNLLNNTSSVNLTVNPPVPIINYYPAVGYASLGFEDLWPGKGDYDFNDIVVDYQFKVTSTPFNYVEKVEATFILRASGAYLRNGFGFQLTDAVSPADLTVTGSSIKESYITLSPNGTEAGQSKPTIIVFDNAFKEFTHPGIGIGVNTEHSAPYLTPITFNVTINFAPGVYTYLDLDIANFNPFIMVDLNRSVEVHLANYPPTDLANTGIFGTMEDASNPLGGIYYVTANNLPWAIHIPESFDYPIEKADITTVYNHFVEWATSGGVSYPDWYQDDPGYRNAPLVY